MKLDIFRWKHDLTNVKKMLSEDNICHSEYFCFYYVPAIQYHQILSRNVISRILNETVN